MACEQTNILILEDDAILAYEWVGGLRARGYHVTHCPTVETGIHTCLQEWPHLVILDANFVHPNGEISREGRTGFCADLCKLARDKSLPIPLMVGVSGASLSKYMPGHVFDGVSQRLMPLRMEKPFATDELIDQITLLLDDQPKPLVVLEENDKG